MQRTILLVEDEPENQLVIGLILSTEGYTVITVDRGDAAVAAAARERPDLILLDVMMPEVNGYEVLARLRATPDTQHVPVVMLTALAQERDVERAVKAGVNGFVSKPFEPADLLACVNAALNGCATRPCDGALSSGSGEEDA